MLDSRHTRDWWFSVVLSLDPTPDEIKEMCLGIPMRIRYIDGLLAKCEAKGVAREANLLMLEHEDLAIGDFVVVHLGYAVDRVTPEEAAAAWEIYDEMLAAEDAWRQS